VAVASPRLVPCKRNHLSGGCGSRTILQRTILQHRQGHNHRHHAEGAGRDRPEMWSPPASVYVTAMSLVSLANAGLSELRGEHMASYSKFRHVVGAAGVGTGRQQQRGALVRRAGRRGRRARAAAQRRARRPLPQTGSEGNSKDFVLQSFHHTPRAPKFRGVLPKICDNAFAIQVPCSAGHMQQSYIYIYIYISTSLKYVPCQVLSIHRYSGNMPLATAATISSSYLLSTVNMIYALHLCRDLPDPPSACPTPASSSSPSASPATCTTTTSSRG
jgi:hypothetical protein